MATQTSTQLTEFTNPLIPPPTNTETVGERNTNFIDQARQTLQGAVNTLSSAAAAVIQGVRSNDKFISRQEVASGEAVMHVQEDLQAIYDILKAQGITDLPQFSVTGQYDAATERAVKAVQDRALIDENGDVYIRLADNKFYKVDKSTGNVTDQVYTGSYKGLVADGVIGPRTLYVLDALRGRGATMQSFADFRTVVGGLWDKSQVPAGSESLVADGTGFGRSVDPDDLSEEVRRFIEENNPHFNVSAGCFRASWHVTRRLLGVGYGSARSGGEADASSNADASKRGDSIYSLAQTPLKIGDVIYVSARPGADPNSTILSYKPHWGVVVGHTESGEPILSDNWVTQPASQWASTYAGPGRKIDTIFRNTPESRALA